MATLDAAAVPFMVVKGPVLAEVIYPRNDMRSYGDLDLVIHRRVFGDAVTALLESGCDMLDRNWRVIRREMRGQVHMAARFGTCADVHWHLVNRGAVRGSFAIDMDELFARADIVSIHTVLSKRTRGLIGAGGRVSAGDDRLRAQIDAWLAAIPR